MSTLNLGVIGNCTLAALVDNQASIVWGCFPQFDGDPAFCRLLGGDDADWGHFTVELVTRFRYYGGETFRFSGDDDLFVFVNGHLAIDLGGLHSAESAVVDLDARRGEFGIITNGTYPFHLFFAERHTVASTFHIESSLAEFATCD